MNRLHFGGLHIDVIVVDTYKNKDAASNKEIELINTYKPKFNKVNNDDNTHYRLNSICYLNSQCNFKSSHYRDDFDKDDMESWVLEGCDFLQSSKPIIFKKVGSYYMLDAENTVFDITNNQLLNYLDLKFLTKLEVESFCVNLFLFGSLDEKDEWRKMKVDDFDLLDLMQSCLVVIEYS